MGRSSLIKIIFLFLYPYLLFAQVGYVELANPVYSFLERMNSLGIIPDYNSFEKPLTRKQIAEFLSKINLKETELAAIEKKILLKYLSEFSFENTGVVNASSFISETNVNYLKNENEKYIYFYSDSSDFNIYVNGIFSSASISKSTKDFTNNSTIINYGLSFRGTISNNIGFYFKATNGTYFGNRSIAQEQNELRYNFKFTKEKIVSYGQNYFDFTEGYIAFENDLINLKIGRDRENIGYGSTKIILGNSSPQFDYLSFRIRYKLFNFSYIHGKLLGEQFFIYDSIHQPINIIQDKYFVYHRFGLNSFKNFSAGFGEMIIYSNRSFDLSYLNPFNFYKSIEHSNQDRDNSIMFFDLRYNPFEGISFYSTFMIDDLDFGKLGTNWYGNKFLTEFGSKIILNKNTPLTYSFQYIKIDPYFYTHHIKSNNYTNFDYGLANDYQPNSYLLTNELYFQLTADLDLAVKFTYSEHGSNIYDDNGVLIINNGGNILDGHRINDREYLNFLDGIKEINRDYMISGCYEFIKNYFFTFTLRKQIIESKFKKEGNPLTFYSSISLKF